MLLWHIAHATTPDHRHRACCRQKGAAATRCKRVGKWWRELDSSQVQVGLSGYMLAAVWGGSSANYSYPLYYDMGAAVQDHFLNWKVTSTSMHYRPNILPLFTAAQPLTPAECSDLHSD